MLISYFTPKRLIALVFLLAIVPASPAWSQFGGFGFSRGVVGGVKVDAEGVVRDASVEERGDQLRQLREAIKSASGEMAKKSSMRMISLKKLQEEIQKSVNENKPLSEEVLFLAGLQRVEYVFAYPDQRDIVLAGPAEDWVVRDDSSVVGKQSGLPVLRLEDLIVALRTTDAAQRDVISVSIEPTAEGQVRVQQLLSKVNGNGFNPEAAAPAIKEAFGAQLVKLSTVPTDSRMAQTLVAADYQMKRLAMNLESSPVSGLPSYMEMVKNSTNLKGGQPRWWIAANYESITHSADKMAWKIQGSPIKALSEDQHLTQSGQRIGTGAANPIAQKWANLFTEKYDQLSKMNAVFGDLRNAIDLNVVAAIIRSQNMQEEVGCKLDLLCGTKSESLPTPQWKIPKTLDPQCSFIHGRAGWVISASGGVEINPWKIVAQSAKSDESVKATYIKANGNSANWWWN
ncbi:MAG: DUF1598 domain-containing protein [Pirellulales bacterium]